MKVTKDYTSLEKGKKSNEYRLNLTFFKKARMEILESTKRGASIDEIVLRDGFMNELKTSSPNKILVVIGATFTITITMTTTYPLHFQ